MFDFITDILLELGIQVKDGNNYRQELRGVQTEAEKTEKSVSKLFNTSNARAKAATTILRGASAAFGAIASVQAVRRSIQAYAVQERAERRLQTALKGRVDVQNRLLQQAQDLANETGVPDEAIVEQQAYLAALGLSESQIREVTAAAIDLSAGLGIGLDSAVRNLSKTYSGLTGELGESIPQLRNFTKEQLQNGAAVKFARMQYEGQARNLRDGTKAFEAFSNAISDRAEQVGRIATDFLAPIVNAATDLIAPTRELSEVLEEERANLELSVQIGRAHL